MIKKMAPIVNFRLGHPRPPYRDRSGAAHLGWPVSATASVSAGSAGRR